MGKQIRFFMSRTDEHDFLKNVLEHKSLIMDNRGCQLAIEETLVSRVLSLFIALPNSDLKKDSNGFIDAIVAEAIQFSRCIVLDGKYIRNGRLWAEFKYYDSNQKLATKSKQFSDMYKSYVNWIKENFRPSKCKDYYIGSGAYQNYKEKNYIMMSGPKHVVEFE